jgi:hypothetical protein
MPADFKAIDRTFDELKQLRLPREAEWQQIADVFLPRKDFTLPLRKGELRRRRLSSSVPGIALARGAGLIVAYMIDNTRPFIKANVGRGLVAAGRPTDLDGAATGYLERLEWSVFDRMMLPQSGFLTNLSRTAIEYVGFGSAVLWTGRKRGFGPSYMGRPLRACWIGQDEEGRTDTLFYQFCLPLWKAVMRWPDHGIGKWRDDMSDEQKCRREVTIVHAVFPRQGGIYGAVSENKPFAECFVAFDEKRVVAEKGYDSFPYAVPRLDVEEGSAYGTGLAWKVLPEALVLNALVTGAENALELRLNPPLLYPARMFGKPLDRRPGAANAYDGAGLGFQTADKAIQKLEVSGDPQVGLTYVQALQQNIEQAFFIDWMRLRDSGNMTAEEVRARTDMRLRSMSAFVPGLDRDLFGPTADRTLAVMIAEGQVPTPPAQLSGVDVDWDFAGPLAIAQLKGQAQSISDLFDVALKARELDPAAPYAVAVEEGMRAVAEALGAPPTVMRSRAEFAAYRQKIEDQQDQAAQGEQVQGAATALRDAGQGVASLTNAGGEPQQAA